MNRSDWLIFITVVSVIASLITVAVWYNFDTKSRWTNVPVTVTSHVVAEKYTECVYVYNNYTRYTHFMPCTLNVGDTVYVSLNENGRLQESWTDSIKPRFNVKTMEQLQQEQAVKQSTP